MPTEVLLPDTLSDAARAALTEELYACHCRIFAGVSRADFSKYVINSPADDTRLFLLRDDDGTIRGYAAFHVFIKAHPEGPLAIVRIETGFERAWRRTSAAGWFVIRQILRVVLQYSGYRCYFLASFVHPSAYVALHRHAPQMWPSPARSTPPEVARLMGDLAEMFHMTAAARPGTVKVGWVTRDDYTPRIISEEARFFASVNPNYQQGEGLLTVAPISAGRLLQGAASYARFRLSRSRHTASTQAVVS